MANTVAFIQGTELEDHNLVDIIHHAKQSTLVCQVLFHCLWHVDGKHSLYNNAAQSFNHEFYWNCLHPNGGGEPAGPLSDIITSSFGGYANFRGKFTDAANSLFGSGWVWLLRTSSGLEIVPTHNAECPIDRGVPLLVLDVWEHAYYLDYQNKR